MQLWVKKDHFYSLKGFEKNFYIELETEKREKFINKLNKWKAKDIENIHIDSKRKVKITRNWHFIMKTKLDQSPNSSI